MSTSSTNKPSRKLSETEFWHWLQRNENRLYCFEDDREAVFDEINDHLNRVHPDLTFEIGPKKQGKREFVISADGIIDAFPAVISLAEAAPSLSRFKVVKFRPRRKPLNIINYQGVSISPENVRFSIEPDGEKIGITLFLRGYSKDENDLYRAIGYLFLDEALGEYDSETLVSYIEFEVLEKENQLRKYPLEELAAIFDSLIKPT